MSAPLGVGGLPEVRQDPEGLRDAARRLELAAIEAGISVSDMTGHWQELSTSYEAPEGGQALSAMADVEAPAASFSDALDEAASALRLYADDVEQIRSELDTLSAEVRLHGDDVDRFEASGDEAWSDDPLLSTMDANLRRRAADLEERLESATRTFAALVSGIDVDTSGLPSVVGGDAPLGPDDLVPADTFQRWYDVLDDYDSELFSRLQSWAQLDPDDLERLVAERPEVLDALVQAQPDPEAVAAWWASLAPVAGGLSAAQRSLARNVPSVLGNLEGLPYDVRDRANRDVLAEERREKGDAVADLDEQIAALRQRAADDPVAARGMGQELNALVSERDALAADLEDLDALHETLGRELSEGEAPRATTRTLVAYDSTGERPLAAVGIGDLGKADTVSYLVSGMGSNVAGMPDAVAEANRVRLREQSNAPDQTIATVAWLDYRSPPKPWEGVPTEVLDTDRAVVGGDRLAASLRGLETVAAADGSSPYLATMAHSYGTTVVFEALKQDGSPVDVAALYGSAGVDVRSTDEIEVPPDGIYATEALGVPFFGGGDGIADVGRIGSGRADPRDFDDVVGFSSGKATAPGGHGLEASRGHSQYLLEDSTSVWNLGLIGVGRGDEVIR